MIYVKHVKSNLKGGVDLDLAPKTLILGVNASGKSAIVNSAELALTGAVGDVVGREIVRDVGQILTLADGEAAQAEASVIDTAAGGRTATFRWETKGKKGGFTAQPFIADQAFTLRDVRAALAGAPDKVRRFFLAAVAGDIARGDVVAAIPEPLRKRFEEAAGQAAGLDALLTALERAKEKLRAVRAEVKTRSVVVQEGAQGLPPKLTAKAFAALESKADAMRNTQRTTLEIRAAETHEKFENATAVAAELREKLAAMPKPTVSDEIRPSHLAVLKFCAQHALLACPTCQRELSAEAASFWSNRVETVQAAADAAAQRNTVYAQTDWALQDAEKDAAGAAADLKELESKLAGLPAAEAAPVSQAERDALEREYRAAVEANAKWKVIDDARDRAAAIRVQEDEWSRLIEACQQAVGVLLDARVESFEKRVQKYLPSGTRFSLMLHDGDREVCRYGFIQPSGFLHTALSGAEWAEVVSAIAAAVADEKRLQIVVPEDRNWDPKTLASVLLALGKSDAQVIIASATEPSEVPAGWAVIRVGAGAPKRQGSFIAVGPCEHGVLNDFCIACKEPEKPVKKPAKKQEPEQKQEKKEPKNLLE